jgi:GNAT superfamily N-acetyltransferase
MCFSLSIAPARHGTLPPRKVEESGDTVTIRPLGTEELAVALTIINDAATAYRNVIPADRWHDPYMDRAFLDAEIDSGVAFFARDDGEGIIGVMGVQDIADVTLIRHAYVSPAAQRAGVGSALLAHILPLATRPVLVGTWAAATWAVSFYQRNGFALVSPAEKDRLLRTYWSIPTRQIETSVVLADERARREIVRDGWPQQHAERQLG